MKLICEVTESVKYLTEEKDGKKSYFIEGVFMQGGIPNRNKRCYPMETLSREVNRYLKENVEKSRAYGELGHPAGPTINLERVSHMIKSLTREGNDYIGKAKVMDTPYGQIVKNLIDEGACLGVSSRGVGSLKSTNEGINEVQEDFMLATPADIVADPSAPDAYVRGIMEGKEWVWDGGILKAVQVESFKKEIVKASRRDLEETKIAVFKKFLDALSK